MRYLLTVSIPNLLLNLLGQLQSVRAGHAATQMTRCPYDNTRPGHQNGPRSYRRAHVKVRVPKVQVNLEQAVCFCCLESPKGSRAAPCQSRGDDGNATRPRFRCHRLPECPVGHDERFPWPSVRLTAR